MEIKKAIIPAAGLGTRFLPLTKVLPKEFLPLVAQPMINYVVREAKDSEIDQIIFILSENKKNVFDYFKKNSKLENILKKRNQKELLEKLKKGELEFEGISFSFTLQQFPKGDGDAVLRAKTKIGKEAFGVLFPDDILVSKIPALAQLKKIFKTSQKPVIALKKLPKEKVSAYGVVAVEKIANRLYKVKEIQEKPTQDQAPSDLVIVGRYVLSPEIFSYLEKTPPNKKGEIILAEALKLMIKDGKIIYGYEIDGEWLECGRTEEWLKSNLYLCLQDPEYGPILREWLKKMK
jgi:UTP--glucose-1-phosphate uridylyltransferase